MQLPQDSSGHDELELPWASYTPGPDEGCPTAVRAVLRLGFPLSMRRKKKASRLHSSAVAAARARSRSLRGMRPTSRCLSLETTKSAHSRRERHSMGDIATFRGAGRNIMSKGESQCSLANPSVTLGLPSGGDQAGRKDCGLTGVGGVCFSRVAA